MRTTAPRFNAKSLAFLRALKRNNDREWFKARKDQYDLVLRAPMIEVIERLAEDFRSFAPDQVASPRISLTLNHFSSVCSSQMLAGSPPCQAVTA